MLDALARLGVTVFDEAPKVNEAETFANVDEAGQNHGSLEEAGRFLEEVVFDASVSTEPLAVYVQRMRAVALLTKDEESKAAFAQLAIEAGLPHDKLHTLLTVPGEPLSLSMPVADGDTHLADLIEDQASPDPFGIVADARMREFVQSLLATMAPNEADVLRRRFGIGGHAPRGYDEIAKETGMPRAHVQRVEKRALETLRTSTQAQAARTFLAPEA